MAVRFDNTYTEKAVQLMRLMLEDPDKAADMLEEQAHKLLEAAADLRNQSQKRSPAGMSDVVTIDVIGPDGTCQRRRSQR